MQEKRQNPRVPVSVKVESDGEVHFGSGYIRDISEKGVGIDAEAFETQDLPSVSQELQLKFMLPGSSLKLTILGKVIRIEKTNKPFLAVEFINLAPWMNKEISKFIQLQML